MASPASGAAAPRKWTPAEDLRLRVECEQQLRQTGSVSDWMAVADKIPYRTNKDCRKRWTKVCATLKKGPWSPDEDARLQRGVTQYGCKWTLVAQIVETRGADQCAKRWQHSLDPHLDRSEWKPEEDRLLLEAVRQYGQSWTSISEAKFPRRSKTDIKNRYSIILRRLKQRPSCLPLPTETPENEDEYDDDDDDDYGNDRSVHSPGAGVQYMNYQSPTSQYGGHGFSYDQSMPDMLPSAPSYLTPEYRSSSSSSSVPRLDQNMGLMDPSLSSRMAASSRSSSSGEVFTPQDMTSMVNPMMMNYDGTTNMMDGYSTDMLAQMDGSQDMGSIAGDPSALAYPMGSSTLTITIEDADPDHIYGITSALLRSKTRFRMQQS